MFHDIAFHLSPGTHLDAFPNQLTPMEDNLYLVDGGFSINSPFPLALEPERDVDIILSFNYSWEAPFEVRQESVMELHRSSHFEEGGVQ